MALKATITIGGSSLTAKFALGAGLSPGGTSTGTRVHTLEAFIAAADGMRVGDAAAYESVADFDIYLTPTSAAPRPGFTLPVGRTRIAVFAGPNDVTALFNVDSNNPRRYVANTDFPPGPTQFRIRTRAA